MAQTNFTTADVLAWARTKPAGERFNFCNPSTCAIAQFGKATGRGDLIGVDDLHTVAPGPLVMALALANTFGNLVTALERIVEPSPVKRTWARLTGKVIGGEFRAPAAASSQWTRADAYLVERVERAEVVSA